MSELSKLKIIYMPAHTSNTWSRCGTAFEHIVMHYVGEVSTARNNGQYYGNTPNIGASAHFFVDEHDIVSSVPLDKAAGHCGVDYSNGKAPYWNTPGAYSTNKRSIGIEMCCKRDSLGRWYIEPETVVMQEWIDANKDARFFVDHHNSEINKEISLLMSAAPTGVSTALKRTVQRYMNNHIARWKSVRKMPSSTVFFYTANATSTTRWHGLLCMYAEKLGVPGFICESAWNPVGIGKDTNNAIGINAESIAGVLTGLGLCITM